LRLDSGKPIDFGLLPCGYLPLEVDTFAMDNSGIAKEPVGRTCAGVDGYCPLAAYLGTQGFRLELVVQGKPRPTRLSADRCRHPTGLVRLLTAVWQVGHAV
jgi:hypothetical protein